MFSILEEVQEETVHIELDGCIMLEQPYGIIKRCNMLEQPYCIDNTP